MTVAQPDDFFQGYAGLKKRINVRTELRRCRKDPLQPYIAEAGEDKIKVFRDDFVRYQTAYDLYYLSLERYLCEMSVAVQYHSGPYWTRKAGCRYSARERAIASRYNAISRYLELDLYTVLLSAKTLLYRTVALSRRFLNGAKRPSFTSFGAHKRFFCGLSGPYGEHEAYAEHIRSQTAWFEMPLKAVRDKFLVHAGPPHRLMLAYPDRAHELALILIPDTRRGSGDTGYENKFIVVSIPQLAWDIHEFLAWYADYGVRVLKR